MHACCRFGIYLLASRVLPEPVTVVATMLRRAYIVDRSERYSVRDQRASWQETSVELDLIVDRSERYSVRDQRASWQETSVELDLQQTDGTILIQTVEICSTWPKGSAKQIQGLVLASPNSTSMKGTRHQTTREAMRLLLLSHNPVGRNMHHPASSNLPFIRLPQTPSIRLPLLACLRLTYGRSVQFSDQCRATSSRGKLADASMNLQKDFPGRLRSAAIELSRLGSLLGGPGCYGPKREPNSENYSAVLWPGVSHFETADMACVEVAIFLSLPLPGKLPPDAKYTLFEKALGEFGVYRRGHFEERTVAVTKLFAGAREWPPCSSGLPFLQAGLGDASGTSSNEALVLFPQRNA